MSAAHLCLTLLWLISALWNILELELSNLQQYQTCNKNWCAVLWENYHRNPHALNVIIKLDPLPRSPTERNENVRIHDELPARQQTLDKPRAFSGICWFWKGLQSLMWAASRLNRPSHFIRRTKGTAHTWREASKPHSNRGSKSLSLSHHPPVRARQGHGCLSRVRLVTLGGYAWLTQCTVLCYCQDKTRLRNKANKAHFCLQTCQNWPSQSN